MPSVVGAVRFRSGRWLGPGLATTVTGQTTSNRPCRMPPFARILIAPACVRNDLMLARSLNARICFTQSEAYGEGPPRPSTRLRSRRIRWRRMPWPSAPNLHRLTFAGKRARFAFAPRQGISRGHCRAGPDTAGKMMEGVAQNLSQADMHALSDTTCLRFESKGRVQITRPPSPQPPTVGKKKRIRVPTTRPWQILQFKIGSAI